MSDTSTELTHEQLHATLAGGKLPRWAMAASAIAAIVVAYLLNVFTSVDGVAGTLVVAVLLFVAFQTGWSFAVEGRRHAVDRLATTGVYATFVVALVPLVAVLATVVVKGIHSLSITFLTTSMRNIDPNSSAGGVYHAIVGTLEQVGIAVNLQTPDRTAAIRQIYTDSDFDLSVSDNVSYADPLIRSTMVYTSETITKTPFRNASGYSNPALDELVNRAAVETDPATRRKTLDAVQRIAAEDLPVFVVAFKRNMTLASPRVKNHSTRPEWMYDSWKDVWLQR